MTRGSFAIVIDPDTYSPDFVTHQIVTSNEIPCDMGPNMVWGMRFGREFSELVESEESFGTFIHDVNEITETECDRFDPDWPHFGFRVSQITSSWETPFVLFDSKKPEANPWRTVFNYSDYAYVKNLSSRGVCLKDRTGFKFELPKGGFFVARYGKCLDGEELKEFYTRHLPLWTYQGK